MSRRVMRTALAAGVAVTMSLAMAGVARAVSGGPYSSPNQNCPWYGSDWNTANGQTYPGCHNAQLTVESGGTTDGNPNNGYNDSSQPGSHGSTDTQWVSTGTNQAPNDPNSQGTPGLLSVGYPGQSGSPHAGCLSLNTDGTNKNGGTGGNASPQSSSYTQSNSNNTCGDNPNGLGFSLTYDYYSLLCPNVPVCEAGANTGAPGQNQPVTFTPDTGSQQTLTDVLTQGLLVYLGMDDNFDNGEHDGLNGPGGAYPTSPLTEGSTNGPSDGGGIVLAVDPQWFTSPGTPTGEHPEGLANLSTGACADGNCLTATTQQETVYYGCNANTGEAPGQDKCANPSNKQRNVYDYSGKQWDPYNCSSGGGPGQTPEPDSAAACGKGGMDSWRQQEAQQVNAEPGVQFYEDPDAEGSPAAPVYPNPALYAGTCGVWAGGGGLSQTGGAPQDQSLALPPDQGSSQAGTNHAGQAFVSSGLC